LILRIVTAITTLGVWVPDGQVMPAESIVPFSVCRPAKPSKLASTSFRAFLQARRTTRSKKRGNASSPPQNKDDVQLQFHFLGGLAGFLKNKYRDSSTRNWKWPFAPAAGNVRDSLQFLARLSSGVANTEADQALNLALKI